MSAPYTVGLTCFVAPKFLCLRRQRRGAACVGGRLRQNHVCQQHGTQCFVHGSSARRGGAVCRLIQTQQTGLLEWFEVCEKSGTCGVKIDQGVLLSRAGLTNDAVGGGFC